MKRWKFTLALLFWPLAGVAQTNFTILKSFTLPDALVPRCTLVAGADGLLYGTLLGSDTNAGTVFALSKNGVGYNGAGYRTLVNFYGTNGANPAAGLVFGDDGRLYGTTSGGGQAGSGTIFKVGTNGAAFAVLHSFAGGADGTNPSPLAASGGALYGTTSAGDVATRGTLFRINEDGSGYSVLHRFTGKPDGQNPAGRLLQASDGALYGTTAYGGSNGVGTVFKINGDGNGYAILHNFRSANDDGYGPAAGVVEGTDHALYGTTYNGGGDGYWGTVFKLNTDGSGYTILHRFSTTDNDAQRPDGELTEGPDGALYGVTDFGGEAKFDGAIYKVNKDGSGDSVVRSFSESDGAIPKCALLPLDGVLYGTTQVGGGGGGCVFALSNLPLPPRVAFLSASGGSNLVHFAATSGINYTLQRSTDLISWSTLTNVTSPVGGQISYSETEPSQSSAFYRLRQP